MKKEDILTILFVLGLLALLNLFIVNQEFARISEEREKQAWINQEWKITPYCYPDTILEKGITYRFLFNGTCWEVYDISSHYQK